MQILDGQLTLSASDLNNYLACPHLTTLDLAQARGEMSSPGEPGADAKLVARKGDEHEARYLEALISEGRDVVRIPEGGGSTEALLRAVDATEEAMKAGREVIYQATFLADGLRGHADFLFRVDDSPSALGSWSYEVADTKLARRAKPYFIVQLAFYSELLARVQGLEPDHIHVILGTGEQREFRLAEFSAYFRHVRAELLAALADGGGETYPEPVEHCRLCGWREACDARRVEDDHLSLVANISSGQRRLLVAAGVTTLAELGRAQGLAVAGISPPVLERLHEQARLQLEERETGENSYVLLEPQEARGFARLPRPSEGDVFFDMEGDPFFDDGGLEYLFGLVTLPAEPDEAPPFTAFWGRDRAEEKEALEAFIDFVVGRRLEHPDLHVYHYATYEITALKRLVAFHGTREEEFDQLLRDQVFVDLYKVVREGLRISQPSYSIKKAEAFYMAARDTAVTDGGDSVIMFERWLEEDDAAILGEIADYNRDDCVSTLLLRDWLLRLREEVEALYAGSESLDDLAWFDPEPAPRGELALEIQEEVDGLTADLLSGVAEDPAERDEVQHARWLMAQLLDYHRREARPVWWAFFDRRGSEPAELTEDADCIGELLPDESVPARKEKRSLVHEFDFPVQETKLGVGSTAFDPAGGHRAGEIVDLDLEGGRLALKRGPKLEGTPLPRALMPGGPYSTDEQRAALRRLAARVAAGAAEGGPRIGAAEQILRRDPPRLAGRQAGLDPIDHEGLTVEELKDLAASLEDSYLFIQGPPGSGKTWSGARVIVDLVRRGNRVGVTSTSHKVIHNLLDRVEEVADSEGVRFRGLKKASSDNPESEYESAHGLVETVFDNGSLSDEEIDLTAGTAWHYCREDTAKLDYLVIDEAGQISLADALALSTATRNVILLGDPQQLPQVAQGTHPPGASVSVLEHLLGDSQTVLPERGIFLERTWRLHPDVCGFVSELMYDGRLRSADVCAAQRVSSSGPLGGTGLRFVAVEHEGRSQSSPEEADKISEAISGLRGEAARYVDQDGVEHPLRPKDILVVTPYNAQVKCLEQRLPPGVRVGTVDKFQGQEAQVVFFSMATSGQEEIPRNVEFLFSRNRLNVAVSRARCVAVLVCNPRLLDIHASSIEQMRLVNALCRFVEIARTA